jgi:hypothetical protein
MFLISKQSPLLNCLLNNRFFFPVVVAIIITLALLPYYSGGTLLFGGEGNVFLNYTEHLHTHQYQWFSQYGFGYQSMAPGANGANVLLLMLVENLTGSIAITSFTLFFSIYFLPFLGMYLLSLEVGAKPLQAFLCASFYLLNPFYMCWLTNLNQFNIVAGAVLPFNFWVIHKYYDDNLKLFLYFGVISTLFASGYTNPPLHAIVQIATLVSVYIVSYHKNDRFLLIKFLKKYALTLISFILFNSWWLISLLNSVAAAMQIYSVSFAEDWLAATVSGAGSPLAKGLALAHIVPPIGSDFYGDFYGSGVSIIVSLIPIVMVMWLIFFTRSNHLIRLNLHILCLVLATLFLIKGSAPPFGIVYQLMFKYVPFFNIFKSPVEKFGLLLVFLFSILVLFVLMGCNDEKKQKKARSILGGYLLFCFIPVVSGHLVPEIDVKIGHVSRKYTDKIKYASTRKYINKDFLIYKTLSLPGMGNYQVLMENSRNKLYSGLDPIRYNIYKPYIAPEEGPQAVAIFKNFMNSSLFSILGLFNVHKLVVNGDSMPWFGTIGAREPEKLRERLNGLPAVNFENISIHTNLEHFVPVLYSPSQIFYLKHVVEKQDNDT